MASTADYNNAWGLSVSGTVYAWVVNDVLDVRDFLQQAT